MKYKYYRVMFETLNADYTPRDQVVQEFDDYGKALDCFNAYDLPAEHNAKRCSGDIISAKTLYEATPCIHCPDYMDYEELEYEEYK